MAGDLVADWVAEHVGRQSPAAPVIAQR